MTSRVMLEYPPDVAKRLREGIAYGHTIVFEKNLALWPLEFIVVSEIKDEHQLKYGREGSRQWSFETSILPNRGDEQTALLLCVENKSGHDELKTEILSNTSNETELVLELEIE